MSKGLFVTGTGTDVGKTYITGLIVKKLRQSGRSAAYYKAAMSGNSRRADGSLIPGDALWVRQVSGIDQGLEEMCPYVYEAAVSPHLAARMEGNPVRQERVLEGFQRLCKAYDYVTMEGSGGILCPISLERNPLWLPDIIRSLGLGCLIVADAGLGTINSVALTAFYMEQHQIPLRGIIFNHFTPGDEMQEDNLAVCQQVTGARMVACVKDGDDELDIPLERLLSLYQ
ncbi:MAG: dethiobiotin synthase [Clostridiales bacterium]|nr:dethiobiotin synthase [Clostridiales bacterium]